MPQSRQPDLLLLVDDELLIRRLMQTVLESVGFRVLTASDGIEALSIYKENQTEIDLVLLDLAMPGMSGEEVLHGLNQLDPNVKVIICSAHVYVNNPSWSEKGVRGVIAKPFKIDNLLNIIEQVLETVPR